MKSVQMEVTCLFISMIVFLSCNILKNERNNSAKDKSQLSINDTRSLGVDQSSLYSGHFLEWRLDSSNTNNTVMIWPKGMFTFSALKGFEGEAERIFLKSTGMHNQARLELRDSLSSESLQVKQQEQHRQIEEREIKTSLKEQVPAFWPIVAVVLISIMGVVVFKYLTKFLKAKYYV